MGGVSFEEYRLLTDQLFLRKSGGRFEQGDSLILPVEAARALSGRYVVIAPCSPWGRLCELSGPLEAPVVSERLELSDRAIVRFTEHGFALIKSVERAALGLGLGAHTAAAGTFREALLAEAVIRFGRLTKKGDKIVADVPLPSLRWILGISGRYQYKANIRFSIIQKQSSPLKIEELDPAATTPAHILLACNPPAEPAEASLIVSPRNRYAIAIAKKSGEPLAAAMSVLEDAKVLRPDLSEEEAANLILRSYSQEYKNL